MKIHIKSVFVRVAFDSMLLSIICKMLYQINQNNVFRMFGYGLQMLVLACCVVQELITFKRKSFDFTVAILLLLISFESLVAISTHSVYMPYAPVDILIWPISVIVYYNYSYAICPKDAITMIEDEEGFEYPQIDENKCVHCYQCIKVCPFKATKEA